MKHIYFGKDTHDNEPCTFSFTSQTGDTFGDTSEVEITVSFKHGHELLAVGKLYTAASSLADEIVKRFPHIAEALADAAEKRSEAVRDAAEALKNIANKA